MASWWMIGSRFPLLILPLSIYPFDGEKRCYFLFRLFGIFFSLSLSDSGWWFMSLYTIAIVNLFRLPPSIGRRGVTWLAIRFFCVFWISRHPRTSYRIKSVYSLMPQTIVERSSFFSFLFFGCVFAEDALVAVMIGRTRAYILRPIVGYSIYACLYLPWAPSWGNCTIRISPR